MHLQTWALFALVTGRIVASPVQIPTRDIPMPPPDGYLHVYALPIGQGDSNVIQCPDGVLSIVDFGSSNDDSDRFWAGPQLTTFLGSNIGQIQNIIITHQHLDHFRFLLDVLTDPAELSGLLNIYISCTAADMDSTMSDWVTSISGQDKIRTFNNGGRCGPLGGPCGTIDLCPNNPEITLDVLAANMGQHCTDNGNKNMDSIVSKITYNDFTLLMPGDFEDETSDLDEDGPQKWMIDFYGNDLQVTVSHISHHGASELSNKPFWSQAIAPTLAWASGDPWYGYGFPRCTVFDGLLNLLSLCKPTITDPLDPEYCGENILDNPEISEILQTAYTCALSTTEFEYRAGNEYAMYTTTPDEDNIYLVDVGTDGTRYGIRFEDARI